MFFLTLVQKYCHGYGHHPRDSNATAIIIRQNCTTSNADQHFVESRAHSSIASYHDSPFQRPTPASYVRFAAPVARFPYPVLPHDPKAQTSPHLPSVSPPPTGNATRSRLQVKTRAQVQQQGRSSSCIPLLQTGVIFVPRWHIIPLVSPFNDRSHFALNRAICFYSGRTSQEPTLICQSTNQSIHQMIRP